MEPIAPHLTNRGWTLGPEPAIERSFRRPPLAMLASVVTVLRLRNGREELRGTAFFIAPGLLVTAAHVIDDDDLQATIERDGARGTTGPFSYLETMIPPEQTLTLLVPTGPGIMTTVPVRQTVTLGTFRSDLAMLHVDMAEYPQSIDGAPIMFTTLRDPPEIGAPCLTLGYGGMTYDGIDPDSDMHTGTMPFLARAGTIEELRPSGRDPLTAPHPMFQIAAAIEPGMSGGPVFDRTGMVIGVISRGAATVDDVAPYAIVSLVAPLLGMPVPDPRSPGDWCNLVDLMNAGLIPTAGSGTAQVEYRGSDDTWHIDWTKQPAKPGRNDPCWCGNGKKFKNCHLQ